VHQWGSSDTEGIFAVDGKTAKQGLDENGRPLHRLNAFVHDLQAVVGQWSTGSEKTNEPTLLRRHLEELLDTYPMFQLITGDAIFAQRPLAELICTKMRYVRQHWRIENSLHFLKDRWWDEDRHQCTRIWLVARISKPVSFVYPIRFSTVTRAGPLDR